MIVPIVMFTEKPEPETVTAVPTTPDEGTRVIAGVVMLNLAELIMLPETGSLTTTRPLFDPLVLTDIPAGIEPEALVVNVWAPEHAVAFDEPDS